MYGEQTGLFLQTHSTNRLNSHCVDMLRGFLLVHSTYVKRERLMQTIEPRC